MSDEELVSLASCLRSRIITMTENNGGHLASNLGIVELTIALHRAFRFSPVGDRIFFDTSHQCYVHKLLTGRDDERFEKLRRRGGYSGFMDPQESVFDNFLGGHAGTALSAALGFAVSRDRRGENHAVVAVLGDASLSCGLTLEALNSVGGTTKRLIIVVNDNDWAIGKSVGSFSRCFEALAAGEDLPDLFGAFGIEYRGPFDGHDMVLLERVFSEAKLVDRPVLLHVCTEKGRGHEAARKNPEKFHGIRSQNSPTSSQPFSDALADAVLGLIPQFPQLVTLTAAMGTGTGLSRLQKEFPDRYIDVGIAEGHAVTFAAGLAASGFRPICAIYATFIQRSIDNIFHDVCLQRLPVIFCMDRAGLSCSDGDTHHGLYDIAQLSSLPNLILAQPVDGQQLHDLIFSALSLSQPVAIRYGKDFFGEPAGSRAPRFLPPGKSFLLAPGKDLSLWPLGSYRLAQCLRLLPLLEKTGLSVEVVQSPYIQPLDEEQLKKSSNCRLLVTLEDHALVGGWGSLVGAALNRLGKNIPLLSFGWSPPVGFAESDALLEKDQGFDDRSVLEKILKKWCSRRDSNP